MRSRLTSVAHCGSAALVLLASLSAMDASAAIADFVFGEDFEAFPTCASASGFAMLASPASRADTLGTQNRYLVKVRSCGDSGSNALGAAGAPASWTTTIDPASLPLASNGYGVALLTVVVPSDGDAGDVNLDVTATANANTVHANAELNIANQYIVTIADGTGNGDHHFPPFLTLRVGTLLRILDDDSTALHRIHGEGNVGFTHQASDMTQGQEYDMTPTMSGTGDFYCHDHGTISGVSQVTVVP